MSEKEGFSGDWKKGTFWILAFTLAGTTIGAGIFGLPYVFSKSGFAVGIFWLFLLGFMMILINLYLGEITLRNKRIHQLPGYARIYLGKTGEKIMLFTVVFGIYSALLAYLIGEGQRLSQLFFGHLDYSIYFGVLFWFLMTLLLRQGLGGLKRTEFFGVLTIIFIIIIISIQFLPQIKTENLTTVDFSNFFFPFGVILFALLGYTSIPELRIESERKGDKKILKNAIILGTLIPIFLYFVFALIFLGVLGNEVEQVSTISFSSLVIVLGVLTMFTSYFVLSFSLKDVFYYDLKRDKLTFIFVSVTPLVFYLLVTFFDLANFVQVLGIGGAVSGGLAGVLILIMHIKSKKLSKRIPEYSIPSSWLAITLLSLILLVGIIFEVF